jgi:hypothetical protein
MEKVVIFRGLYLNKLYPGHFYGRYISNKIAIRVIQNSDAVPTK